MTPVLLTTRLKVADPTALTATTTLRTRLGYDTIAAVGREELFLFEVDAGPDEAEAIIDGLVRRTNLFLNPNKHLYRITAAGRDKPAAPGLDFRALVWNPGDGEDLRESLWSHAGAVLITAVRRAWLWRFVPASGAPEARFREQVRDSIVLRSRTHGFLVNPACQDSRLYDVRPSVYDIREALSSRPASPAEA
jgi:phosphoribosylformylglycinamidine (FGAM) synthase PurS component